MTDTIIDRCAAIGLRMTDQRKTIAQVLQEATDHPDVEQLYARAVARDEASACAEWVHAPTSSGKRLGSAM